MKILKIIIYGFMAYAILDIYQYFDLVLYKDGIVLMLPEAQAPDQIPEFVPKDKLFQVQKISEEWGDRLDISTVGELNDQIVVKGLRQILLIQEALQESKISEIARADRPLPEIRSL